MTITPGLSDHLLSSQEEPLQARAQLRQLGVRARWPLGPLCPIPNPEPLVPPTLSNNCLHLFCELTYCILILLELVGVPVTWNFFLSRYWLKQWQDLATGYVSNIWSQLFWRIQWCWQGMHQKSSDPSIYVSESVELFMTQSLQKDSPEIQYTLRAYFGQVPSPDCFPGRKMIGLGGRVCQYGVQREESFSFF